jgi:anti-sigma regulatory factor (Ser/Thr protein kinase)
MLIPEAQSLARVRHNLTTFLKNQGVSQSIVYDFVVAVSEALTNAIEYGNDSPIELSVECSSQHLSAIVKNKGEFDKKTLAYPNSCRGRGILLMLALMDHIEIDEGEGTVTVKLVKKLKTVKLSGNTASGKRATL